MTAPIATALLRLLRAQDRSGAWDAEADEVLLAPFIVPKAKKRELPLIGDPDPDILWRVGLYYGAVAWEIERRCGRAVQPMMDINHEGWGRVMLIAGRLVAVRSHLRELHRFGFESVDDLVAKGETLVAEGIAIIDAHPAVAEA